MSPFSSSSLPSLAIRYNLHIPVDDIDATACNVETLRIPDRARFMLFGTGPRRAPPSSCMHEIFSTRAQESPSSIAAIHSTNNITYRELDAVSDRIAEHIHSRGATSGRRICVLSQRSISMLCGILGVLKSGASYVPLDGGVVTDQALSHILGDSGALLVLYTSQFHHKVPTHIDSVCLDEFTSKDPSCRYTAPVLLPNVDISSEAYVIYTSGTTGLPKGVRVTHANVVNLLCSFPGSLGIKPGVKVAQLLNVAFDMCVWEIFGCLLNGGTLVLRGSSRADWEQTLRAVDVVIATPSVLQGYSSDAFPNIRIVAVAGEPCSKTLADRWAVGRRFYNCCGPTETTIVNTMHLHKRGAPLSIGTPTPNNRVYILDEKSMPVPIGSVGTLWAAGCGVSAGYVNMPEFTARKYVPDPFYKGGMMYNTGDLGRWTENGEIQHLGRVDDQVKVKGFRVELDGVASVLEGHSSVTKAVSLLVNGELWAFMTPQTVCIEDVKWYASGCLPYYSIPGSYLTLDEFPTTNNGKVDKKFLLSLVEDPRPYHHEKTPYFGIGKSCRIM